MAFKYRLSNEEIEAIKAARRVNKNKRADARLKALDLHAEGMKAKEVSQATRLSREISNWRAASQ